MERYFLALRPAFSSIPRSTSSPPNPISYAAILPSAPTVLTEIDLKNTRHELYPGMYANVTLELERHRDALELPPSAIGESSDGKYVMVAEGGKLRRQAVTVGINNGKSAEIVSGLSGSEEVVTAQDPSIVPDQAVNIVEQKPQPDERSNMVAATP